MKVNCVLHDEAICKAIIQDKPTKKSQKCLQFSQSAKQVQSSKRSGHQPSGSRTVFRRQVGRGRSFEGSFASLCAAGGGILGRHCLSWNSSGA